MTPRVFPCLKLSFFTFLNVADLVLTRQLLAQDGDWVYESNPFADWILQTFGWAGLGALKVAVVSIVLTCAWVLLDRRPQQAQRVLTAGCVVLTCVVLYSTFLFWQVRCRSEQLVAEHPEILQRECELKQQLAHSNHYRQLLDSLIRDLVAGRRSLADAIAELARSPKARDPVWLACLHRRFPCLTDGECIAASLMEHTLESLSANVRAVAPVVERLGAEYHKAYGRPLPLNLAPPAVARGRILLVQL